MNMFVPKSDDLRIGYAMQYLQKKGIGTVHCAEKADFILLGIHPKEMPDVSDIPIFAGGLEGKNIVDYTKNEAFALKNAFLTAEAAICTAVLKSDKSMVHSKVLIVGYGRIGKALHAYIMPMTKNVTICVRSKEASVLAEARGASVIRFNRLKASGDYDFIFNTVPHPVFNKEELKNIPPECLLMDLASFPGGVDRQWANYYGVNLMIAGGLPGKVSPLTAGTIIGETILSIINNKNLKEVKA